MDNEQAVQTEDEALSEVMSGYDNTPVRGEQPPIEDEDTDSAVEEVLPETTEETTVTALSDELKELKARVATSQDDADTVRKMHGEIGNINRTLLKMQTPTPVPLEAEDTAELDNIAEEYPELAGPIVKMLKANQARMAQMPASQSADEINSQVNSAIHKIRESDAIETLQDEHPDYVTVRDTPAFKTWLSGKAPEFQDRLQNTWNPAIVSRGLTEYKETLKKRQTQKTRLSSAITPQGVPQKTGSSTLPDEEGLWIGYNKGRKRL